MRGREMLESAFGVYTPTAAGSSARASGEE
jgi:hypothetical protein